MGQCPALNTWKVLYKIHYLLFTTESIAQDNRMSHALGQVRFKQKPVSKLNDSYCIL